MRNFTSATVEGNVTHDPILRQTKTGKSVCNFSVAVNHYSAPDTEPKVSFMEIETWEKVADMCAEHVTKGKRLMVIGTLKQDRWEGKDGKMQSRIKLVGNEIRFLNIPRKDEAKEETVVAE